MNSIAAYDAKVSRFDSEIDALLDRMTLAEKIGQMCQWNVGEHFDYDGLANGIRSGYVGSLLNTVDVNMINELQRVALEESRLGIPLLIGRDVIHGFNTVAPIPLGQAATWNPTVVTQAASAAAAEAARAGVNWTFSPMVDVARDPRWGRIAESFGEDPVLAGKLGAAMIAGYQGKDLSANGKIAACAKHFAGYGAVESGRDYATTNLPENELRNVYLRPFADAVGAGVSAVMTSFSDIDGVPATANTFLLRDVLRGEWGFDGLVISDWDSIRQLQIHGLTANDKESAFEAATAGVDMEMFGDAYAKHLQELIEEGRIDIRQVDTAVANILRAKFRLGLFNHAYVDPESLPPIADERTLAVYKQAAAESIVLLTNNDHVLPLGRDSMRSIAVIGPLADAPYEQLGTWIFDGDASLSVTPLAAIKSLLGESVDIHYEPALPTSRSHDRQAFDAAVNVASSSEAVILFLGEESILSGEAHSRADIGLPGAQVELVKRIRAAGKPVIAVIQAGRPLTLTDIVDEVDAILFAWHPGTMGGPAIADVLFGELTPSGKLPVSFPKMVGQVPIYYSGKNTGKPPSPETVVHIDDIDPHASQLSTGMTAFHLDAGYLPLFPFGYGLSYAEFRYENLRLSSPQIEVGGSLTVRVDLFNTSDRAGTEVVQLYVRDLVGSTTRPVRELKDFQRVYVEPHSQVSVIFEIHSDMLGFFGRNQSFATEPGEFHVWVGADSNATLMGTFEVMAAK
ncbi:MAG: glycoside hydrolase family 3 N-terminal domain-containing protein [Pseudomonadota bacterium]